MTNGIYLGELNGTSKIDVYSALRLSLRSYCGKEVLPVARKTDSCMLFDGHNLELKATLEMSLCGKNNGFLENVSFLIQPPAEGLLGYLGFKPDYSVGFIAVTNLEPQNFKDGNFGLDIGRKLKEHLGCKCGVVIMNGLDRGKWIYKDIK